MLKWFPAVRAWFGGWVTEASPPSSDSSELRWLFRVDYEDEGQECGTPWKKASVEDIEAMMAAGKGIILHGC